MTKTQLCIMGYLLNGHNIAAYRTAKFRLRDENNCVVLTMSAATFRAIKPLTRKTPAGLFVVDKNKVRQLHGNDQVKRYYKGLLDNNISSGGLATVAPKLFKSLTVHHSISKVAEKRIKNIS